MKYGWCEQQFPENDTVIIVMKYWDTVIGADFCMQIITGKNA